MYIYMQEYLTKSRQTGSSLEKTQLCYSIIIASYLSKVIYNKCGILKYINAERIIYVKSIY